MRRTAWIAALVLAGCGAQTPPTPADSRPAQIPADAQKAVVDRVVDGDTLWVRAEGSGPLPRGARTKVRLLELDTPERGECWFDEATEALMRLTPPGATVWLAADREPLDRYGRALRYAWTDSGVFVELEMVRTGMGRALLVRPNDAHIVALRAGEAQARQAGRGMWQAC